MFRVPRRNQENSVFRGLRDHRFETHLVVRIARTKTQVHHIHALFYRPLYSRQQALRAGSQSLRGLFLDGGSALPGAMAVYDRMDYVKRAFAQRKGERSAQLSLVGADCYVAFAEQLGLNIGRPIPHLWQRIVRRPEMKCDGRA